jgi:hypothetical protein
LPARGLDPYFSSGRCTTFIFGVQVWDVRDSKNDKQ